MIFLFGCNFTTNNAAVAFLWNEEPEPASSRIMVITEYGDEELRANAVKNLEDLGFVVEFINEDKIVTEPLEMNGKVMRISLELNNNVIVISGDEGAIAAEDDINWQPVSRGEDADPYASPEWELMNVLASSFENTSIRYN